MFTSLFVHLCISLHNRNMPWAVVYMIPIQCNAQAMLPRIINQYPLPPTQAPPVKNARRFSRALSTALSSFFGRPLLPFRFCGVGLLVAA
jgi:hypothetical protein